MLQAQQDGKRDTAVEKSRLLARQDNRQHQNSVQETVVLEMNVVDNEQTGGQENREAGNVRKLLISWVG